MAYVRVCDGRPEFATTVGLPVSSMQPDVTSAFGNQYGEWMETFYKTRRMRLEIPIEVDVSSAGCCVGLLYCLAGGLSEASREDRHRVTIVFLVKEGSVSSFTRGMGLRHSWFKDYRWKVESVKGIPELGGLSII
jgi:hypothetical protein